MRVLPARISGWLPQLPHGWGDAGRQLGLFVLADICYETVRGVADGQRAEAYANAAWVIDVESATGTLFEPDLQAALLDFRWVVDVANFSYMNTHFVLTTGFLVWLYLYRNEHFYFVRNMFMVAMALALVGYALVQVRPGSAAERYAWIIPETIAELMTLVVTDGRRGEGIGGLLLDEMDAELERQGINEVLVGLIPGNDGAQRLYESRGFRSRWLTLVRSR